MAKRELSPKQQAFQDFFFSLLDEYEINSPAQLEEKEKIEFFNKVKKGWKKYKKENFNENNFSEIKSLIDMNKKVNNLIKDYKNNTI